jgi:hypothetical protein
MPIVHDVHGLLQSGQANTDRYEYNHIQQPIAIVRRIAALEELRANHQPTGGQHNPHRNGYAALTRILAVQLHPYIFVNHSQITWEDSDRTHMYCGWDGIPPQMH